VPIWGKIDKIGDTLNGFSPPTKDVCAKFHQNRLKIATMKAHT